MSYSRASIIIKDTSGADTLSFIERLSFGGRLNNTRSIYKRCHGLNTAMLSMSIIMTTVLQTTDAMQLSNLACMQ